MESAVARGAAIIGAAIVGPSLDELPDEMLEIVAEHSTDKSLGNMNQVNRAMREKLLNKSKKKAANACKELGLDADDRCICFDYDTNLIYDANRNTSSRRSAKFIANPNTVKKCCPKTIFLADQLIQSPTDPDIFIIPDGITHIANGAFWGGHSGINDDYWISKRLDHNMDFYMNNSPKQIIIPDSVISIGWGAFAYCTTLKTMVIGDNVKTMGIMAFQGCRDLEYVKLPNQLSEIGKRFFWGCESLKSITIPRSVKFIDTEAFFKCNAFETISVPFDTVVQRHAIYPMDRIKRY